MPYVVDVLVQLGGKLAPSQVVAERLLDDDAGVPVMPASCSPFTTVATGTAGSRRRRRMT